MHVGASTDDQKKVVGVGQAMQGGGPNISLSSAELWFVMLAKSRQGSMRCDAGVGFVLVDSKLVSEEWMHMAAGRAIYEEVGGGGGGGGEECYR